MSLPYYHQGADDSNNFACGMSFSADEILRELKVVLNKNITHEKQRNAIVVDVANQLTRTSRHVKCLHYSEKIKMLSKMINDKSPNRRPQAEINKRIEHLRMDLLNIISFIQMYGGLDPQGAQELKIVPNFIEALFYQYDMMRNIKWIRIPNELKPVREEFERLCIKNYTSVLNANIMNFESHNLLLQCINCLIDIDFNGSAAELLIPPVRAYYEKFELQRFLKEPTFSLLNSAINQSILQGIDISKSIDDLKVNPEDARKFYFLFSKMKNCPHLKKNVIKAALETTNFGAIAFAFKSFPEEKEIERHYYNKLALAMNNWLTYLIRFPDPMKSMEVRERHAIFRNMLEVIGPEGRRNILSVAAESELGKAIAYCVESHSIDLNNESSMAADISTIVQMVNIV